MSLDHVRLRLAQVTPEQLAAIAGIPRPEAPPAVVADAPPTAIVPETATATQSDSLHPSEPWSRVSLLPGLELHVRSDAAPFVRRVAAEIASAYRVTNNSPA